ncbi:hypothetical protein [Marixanthomonas spongiae]|uniref:Uncharacterized protein n=1 Tax=Marixanthomonas spongiae TaxID=2174845 RepID=A0A2U0HWD3_9FLAO|nr:hypothetical protein [Marixanthomonas spongiae]PVW13165.1 hypothetical protein DDV96_13740 [Marixanthomonas spongiae]
MNKIKNIVDKYLFYALFIDVAILLAIWLGNTHFSIFDFKPLNNETNIKILSNLIGASISLAGFVLASLTIIVAIRSNVKTKRPEEADTPLELFFSIGTYKTIVKVFKIAIIELVFCFIVSYIVWMASANITNYGIFKVNVCLIFLLTVSTMRSLFVLFLLIARDDKASG